MSTSRGERRREEMKKKKPKLTREKEDERVNQS